MTSVLELKLLFMLRETHKKVLLSVKRQKLKEVGKRARHDIEMLLGSKVYLELWVKVQKDWRNKVNFIRQMGYIEDQD